MLLEELQGNAEMFTVLASETVFKNSNARKGASHYKVVDAMEPLIARNNCWVISKKIMKAIESDPKGLDATYDSLQVTGIDTPAGSHYGLLVTKGEEGVIVDFSARQFDPEVAFPLVMDMWEWQYWCEKHIGRQGTWLHEEYWDY